MFDFLPNDLKAGDWVGILNENSVNFLPIEKIDRRGTITLIDKTRWNRWTGIKWGDQSEQVRLNTPWVFVRLLCKPCLVSKEEGLRLVKDMAENF